MNILAKCGLKIKNSRKVLCLPNCFLSRKPEWPFIDIPVVKSSMILSVWNGGPKLLHKYIDQLHTKHGPAFYKETSEGPKVLFVCDPELNLELIRCEGKYPVHIVPEAWTVCLEELELKRGLFFMDGSEWKKNRVIMTEIMGLLPSVQKIIPLINLSALHLVNKWKQKLPTGKNLERELHRWSCESVALAFIGTNMNMMKADSKCGNIPDEFLDATYSIFDFSSKLTVIPPILAQKWKTPNWKKFSNAIDTALKLGKEVVEDGIAKHRDRALIHPCIMTDMLECQKLSDDIIFRIIIDMIITSGDTSSIAAVWVLYTLGRNEEIAEKCLQEVKEAVGDKETIDLSDLTKMPYLAAVCKETMRLYPVAPFLTRLTSSELMYKEYYVPKDTMVATSLFTMLRDKNIYPEPDKLIPERWIRQQNESRETRASMSRSFIPFGIGGRSCIAKHISKVQLQILVAHILLNFNWKVMQDVKPVLRMITVPDNELKLNVSVK